MRAAPRRDSAATRVAPTTSNNSGGGARAVSSRSSAAAAAVQRTESSSSDLAFPSVPSRNDSTSDSIDFPSVPSHPDDANDDDDDGGGIAFPNTPASKPSARNVVRPSTTATTQTLDVDAFPSIPNVGSRAPPPHETLDTDLFPSVPRKSSAAPPAADATLDASAFAQVPSSRSVDNTTNANNNNNNNNDDDDDGDDFACPWCEEAFSQLLALQRHTKDAHKRDLTYECVFPHCTKSYTEQANLLSHMRKQHPGYLTELGLEEAEHDEPAAPPVPEPLSSTSTAVARAPLASPAKTRRIDPKLAARRAKALDSIAPPDPKKSIYRDFLLDPDDIDVRAFGL
jgi:hypothetical protein